MHDTRKGNAQPRWGALDALLAMLTGLLGLIAAVLPPGTVRRVLELVVALAIFGVMAIWVRANRVRLDLARDPRRGPARIAPMTAAPRPRSLEDETGDRQMPRAVNEYLATLDRRGPDRRAGRAGREAAAPQSGDAAPGRLAVGWPRLQNN